MSKQKQTNKEKSTPKNQQPIFRSEDKHNPSFFGTTPIQTELKVGQPNDPYEQEANKISAQFLHNYDQLTGAQTNVAQNGGSLQTMLQPKLAGLRVNRKIQKKLQFAMLKSLQKNEASPESNNVVDSSIEQQINSSKGGGQAIDTKTKTMMEASFGADFSSVRIHTGSKANEMSKSLNAHAFTVGNDIYFNENSYNPESRAGKGLLAHELTHVVQQGAAVQKKRKDFLPENTVQNAVGGKYAQNASLFRKEIAQFQQANPEEEIATKQQDVLQTQTVDTVQKKSPANTLRKYSGGGGGSTAKKAKLKKGPTYSPNGVIKATKSGTRKTASFNFSAEFEHDPSKGIYASCGQVRQYIKWSSAGDKPNHAGFAGSSYKPGTWYEDRDGNNKRYGHRSGSYSDPQSFDQYVNSSGTRDQLKGPKYIGSDTPVDGSGAKTGFWYFKLEAIDTCNGNKVLGTDTVTVDW